MTEELTDELHIYLTRESNGSISTIYAADRELSAWIGEGSYIPPEHIKLTRKSVKGFANIWSMEES
jgi:hypothetical protein